MVRAKINQYFLLGSNIIIDWYKPTITMTVYIENIGVHSDAESDACWVADSDGWYYWSKPLIPGKATNLLLEGVTFNW